ncbi:MAG: hypothetical protein ACRCUT_06965, partial [Spirochaetota bacterium]
MSVKKSGEGLITLGGWDRHCSLSEFTYRLRIPILFLTPVSILLGAAAAVRTGGSVDPREVILLLAGALSCHLAMYNLGDFAGYLFGDTSAGKVIPFRSLLGSPSSDSRTAYASLLLSIVLASAAFGICVRFALKVSPFVFLYWGGAVLCFALFRILLHRV